MICLGDYPMLPLHPQTAHITNVLTNPYDQEANSQRLDRTICMVHGLVDESEKSIQAVSRWLRSFGELDGSDIGFQASDGVVKLGDAASRWFLAGRQVESYECF